jgi:isopentenyl phosphate kinase
MGELVFLKLGGSLITDKNKPHHARRDRLQSLASELHSALRQKPDLQVLLGHGSGSFGHVSASKYHTREGVASPEQWQGFLEVWRDAKLLNEIVMKELAKAEVPAIAFSPVAQAITEARRVMEWNPIHIQSALQNHLVPVIYGDVIFDKTIGGTILSTEEQFEYLAAALKPDRILIAGLEQGVWKDFPDRTEIFPEISSANFHDVEQDLHQSENPDVTGGMHSKVINMLNLVKAGHCHEVCIFSAIEPGRLLAALNGSCSGTRIHR